MDTRILCVNCNVCVNSLRRYRIVDETTRLCTLLCNWIYPQIISHNDYVCEACRDLALAAVNDSFQQDAQAGSSRTVRTDVCLLCGCLIARRQSDKVLRENPTDLQQQMINIIRNRIEPRELTTSDRVCHVCWLRTKREALRINIVHASRNEEQPPNEEQSLPQNIEQQSVEHAATDVIMLPDYRRAANTGNHCVFSSCQYVGTRHTISDQLRAIILSNHKYYIPKLARVCSDHLSSNSWNTLYESDNSVNAFTADQVQHIFSFINKFNNKTIDFEKIEDIDDSIFHYWVGFSKEKLNILLEEIPRIMTINKGRLGLIALLIKMRTGDSNNRIASLLQKPRSTLEKLMNSVREILLQDFVPNNLGIDHITREELLLEHTLIVPNRLYGHNNNLVVICDGTYIYSKKSSNYKFQKDTYSLHKYKNLLKTFLIVASDGYIIECAGPYKATTSDAEIMTTLFSDETSPLRFFFIENDAFVLDRGFRDSINLMEECGYKTFMPESLLPNNSQLTTAQANRSRCVTICRWVVEVVNGYFKRDFKIFRQEYSHVSLPHMMEMFQIAAALINRFGARLKNNEYANDFVNIINEKMHLNNNLANFVENENLNRRSANFQNIVADRNNTLFFPHLELRELILFALGTYQIRQARSYYGEHIRFQGEYRIEVSVDSSLNNLREETTLIRGRIKSRHVSRKQYYVYILIENNNSTPSGITDYCCNCLVGRRTIGCCSHIMTIVWYLGWARHQPNIAAPAEFLDDVAIDL